MRIMWNSILVVAIGVISGFVFYACSSAHGCRDECDHAGDVLCTSGPGLLECGDYDNDGCLEWRDSQCNEFHVCRDGECVCEPASCESLGRECGSFSDHCGGTVVCGDTSQVVLRACGPNTRGTSIQDCIAGVWEEVDCIDTEECQDGLEEINLRTCGLDEEGTVDKICVNGFWEEHCSTLRLVEDINVTGADSWPTFMEIFGSSVLVSADSVSRGRELWWTDGTELGTKLLKDIQPGRKGSHPSRVGRVEAGLVFWADDGVHGRELWITDGTELGTKLVKDIYPGPRSANPDVWREATLGGFVLFMADDGVRGCELWKSDGTEAGTTLIKDIYPGLEGSCADEIDFVIFDDMVYFYADDGQHGMELYKSDGTEAGTVLVKDIQPGSGSGYVMNPDFSFYNTLVVAGDHLFFLGNDGTHGTELFVSNGTDSGTTMVLDMDLLERSSYFYPVGAASLLFFEINGDLWRSNGTEEGTFMVTEIQPSVLSLSLFFKGHIEYNGKLYFFAYNWNGYETRLELWVSDGTISGTSMVHDLDSFGFYGRNMLKYNEHFYFSEGQDLYRSDGTNEGTVPVTSLAGFLRPEIVVGEMLFLRGDDGIQGAEIWKYNGAEETTSLVADIHKGTDDAEISDMTPVANKVFFSADDGIHGGELHVSDGTASGTHIVKDIFEGNMGSEVTSLIEFKGQLFFLAHDGIHGWELWRSDGTEAGTILIRDTVPGEDGIYFRYYKQLGVFNDLLFINVVGPHNSDIAGLWISDGTEQGTVRLHQIRPVSEFAVIDDAILFEGCDGSGSECALWKSDGTKEGTVLVKDIDNGDYGRTEIYSMTSTGNTVFFFADDRVHGLELWKSDGTTAGTMLVKDIYPGEESASLEWPVTGIHLLSSQTICFFAEDGTHGQEMWVSDGSPEGTRLLKDIRPGLDSSLPVVRVSESSRVDRSMFIVVDGILFFTANDGTHGIELWRTDGTQSGTSLFWEFTPGSELSGWFGTEIRDSAVYEGIGIFTVVLRDDSAGRECSLWQTDGSLEGTKEIFPIECDGMFTASQLQVSGSRIFFSGWDSAHGNEIWTLTP